MKRYAAALLLLVAAPAIARELAGVTMPDTASVAGKTLKLNGMGLRTKWFFKVYVAGLYLENPTRSAEAAVSADQVKRVELRLLRDLDRGKITEAISEGFEQNSKPQLTALKPRLDRLNAMIPDVKKGDPIV